LQGDCFICILFNSKTVLGVHKIDLITLPIFQIIARKLYIVFVFALSADLFLRLCI